jgi:hypothetical protein
LRKTFVLAELLDAIVKVHAIPRLDLRLCKTFVLAELFVSIISKSKNARDPQTYLKKISSKLNGPWQGHTPYFCIIYALSLIRVQICTPSSMPLSVDGEFNELSWRRGL